MSETISERAYSATLELLQLTSKAPSIAEFAKCLENFALAFGYEVGGRLLQQRLNTEESAIAVRNAVDRAAKGEP